MYDTCYLNWQKVIFLDTADGVATTLRPYWEEAIGNRATVVQAVADMLEIVPPGTSKGSGVKLLLDHLGVSPKEVYAQTCFLPFCCPLFPLLLCYHKVYTINLLLNLTSTFQSSKFSIVFVL